MQLRYARLCLNCEEIHTAAHCPVCASESFSYMSRWVPAEDRRREQRAPKAAVQPAPTSGRGRWVKRGAAGVAVIAASRFLWQMSRPVEWSSVDLPADKDSEGREE